MAFHITRNILGLTLTIYGPRTLVQRPVDLGWEIKPNIPTTAALKYINGPMLTWHTDGKSFIYSLPYDLYKTSNISSLEFFAAEYRRQLDGHFIVHGSSVAGQRGGVLVLGGSGSGKTSLSVLLSTQWGACFGSSDLTSIWINNNSTNIWGHNPSANIRWFAMKRFLNSRLSTSSNASLNEIISKSLQVTNASSWDYASVIRLDHILDKFVNSAAPLVAIIDAKVVSGERLHVAPLKPWKVRTLINEEICRYLGGFLSVVDDEGRISGSPLIANDSNIFRSRQILLDAVGVVPGWRMTGDLFDMAVEISQLLN